MHRAHYRGSFRFPLGLPSAFALALLLGLSLWQPVARADGGSAQFGLRPVTYDPNNPATASYFIFNSESGATINSQVRVTNSGSVRGRAALYPVDATTGQTSGTVYLARQDARKDVGAWVTVAADQLTLDPGQSQVVSFSVSVPKGSRPGQHVGGIVAENLDIQQGSSSGSVQVNIQHLTIIAVEVNLPGEQIQKLEGGQVRAGGEHSYQVLYVSLRNSGTQLLKPYGTVQVADTQGHQLKNERMSLDTFLPQTAIDYPVFVDGQALGPGHYRAILTLNYGDQLVLRHTSDFEITQQDLDQTFGGRPPNTLPATDSDVGLKVVAGIVSALGILALLLVILLFVPALRARFPLAQVLHTRLFARFTRANAPPPPTTQEPATPTSTQRRE